VIVCILAACFALSLQPTAEAQASRYDEPYPSAASKKGLQVQMVDDALALGVKHAALNLDLAQIVDVRGDPSNPSWTSGGRPYRFKKSALEAFDAQVKPLSDRGVLVYAILLARESGDAETDRVLLHPKYDKKCPNHLAEFDAVTDDGQRWLAATMEFLAERWSRPDRRFGRVVGWIVGNEVNSHWFWANMGHASMTEFTDDYARVLRVVCGAVRRESSSARVYVSLEHHWNIRYAGGDESQTFPARPFLERLASIAGDVDWNVAFHPYPENLFEPRTWIDKTATTADDTPRITFKNIEMLPRFLKREPMLFGGKPRHAILSEQGFHTPDGADGETIQAAAFCYAWKKVEALDGIDAFILHRHVDHRDEGGLRLGLWTRDPASVCTPRAMKKLWEVFRSADTNEQEGAFAFALPLIGLTGWNELRR
jgi:Family of unknown function (DUF5722)